jgi:signal transduction histidine kinase
MRIRRQDFTLIAQAIAIVLPVVALSGIALHFLQEDRAAIDREAGRRAQSDLAVESASLKQELKNGIDHPSLVATIRNGSLWIAGDYPQVPEPPWSEALTRSELQLLETSASPDVEARLAALAVRTPAGYRMPSGIPIRVRAMQVALRRARGGILLPNVMNALESTIRECPDQAPGLLRLAAQVASERSSARLAAIRQAWNSREAARHEPSVPRTDPYARLQLLEAAEKRRAPDLVSRSIELASRAPASVTPAGTPIGPLALLVGLRHIENGAVPQQMLAAIHDQVASYPSFLTPELLHAAGQTAKGEAATRLAAIAGEWRLAEEARETKRALMRTASAQLVGPARPAAILPGGPRGEWLALCDRFYDGWNVRLIPNLRKRPPKSYLGLVVEIDQQRWWLAGPEKSNPKVLASSSGRLDNGSQHTFLVMIDLADPDQLYHPYQTRLLLTRLLICSAAVTALIGLASLWTSYRRQARLSEMKSNFVSSVSHELRAPLGAIRLMAESLHGGRIIEEDKRRDYYRLIVQECRRLSGLVENVLDLSRIGDGDKSYHFEPVDLAALLRQSAAIMEPCAAERRVTLRLTRDAADNLRPCWDAAAVQQSLVNLLDNAIKHSPDGSIVDIRVEQEDGKIRIWVEDSGPGIPIPEQRRIFELFYRLGTELRRETKGVGIGLAIVRGVADAHGGRVIVDSEVGRGSRFGLELPMEHPL